MEMSKSRSYLIKYPTSGAVLGSVVYRNIGGWWFISRTSARANGRRNHQTAEGAIPTWARKMGCVLEKVGKWTI